LQVRGYRIFYIDPEEGIREVINLIEETTASKIALVVHERLNLLKSQINLKLLKEYCDKEKKEIVFINPNKKIINILDKTGFKSYADLNTLEEDMPFKLETAGSKEEKEKGKEGHFKNLFISLIGISIILVLAWMYFFYPTATIVIKPVVKTARQEVEIQGSLDLNKIDWKEKILPLHKFELSITDEDIIDCTGIKLIGETKSRGVVKFINERQSEVLIPAGTVLETVNSIKFKTIEDVSIPGLKIDYLMDVPVGMKAGQAEVEIEALDMGSQCNLQIGSIKKIMMDLEKVHVINPEPTRGGKDKNFKVVSENDVQNLKARLEEKIKNKLLSSIYQKLGGNYRVIDNEIKYSNIEFEFKNKPGDLVDKLEAVGKLMANGYLLKNNELDRLTTNIFKDYLQDNYKLSSAGVNIEHMELAELGEGLYNIKLELIAQIIPVINTIEMAKDLSGKEILSANELLSEIESIDDFEINSASSFLPKLGFAIKIVVNEPDSFEVLNLTD
jgi:hypothetical protein